MLEQMENGTAGQPAGPYNFARQPSERDREIVRRITAGEEPQKVRQEFGISYAVQQGAFRRVERQQKGLTLLASDPQHLEGLYLSGQLPSRTWWAVRRHSNDWEGPEVKRLSDIAALGRVHWCYSHQHHGPASVVTVDGLLLRAGIEWAGDEAAPERRKQAPRPQPQEVGIPRPELLRFAERLLRERQDLLARIERLERRSVPAASCTTTEVLETIGNVTAFPGVKLSDILPNDQHI